MKKVMGIIITLVITHNSLFITTFASHQPFTEGWYCDDEANQVWHDIPDEEATHELWEDCNLSAEFCTWLESPPEFNANADCLAQFQDIVEETPIIFEEEPMQEETIPLQDQVQVPEQEQQSESQILQLTQGIPKTECGNSHETALCNLNMGLLPPEIAKNVKPKEEGLFTQVIAIIESILGFNLTSKGMFASRAEIQHQAEFPIELEPKEGNILEQTRERLGGSSGFYSISIPREVQKGLKLSESEEVYEKANFLEGIRPITGNSR